MTAAAMTMTAAMMMVEVTMTAVTRTLVEWRRITEDLTTAAAGEDSRISEEISEGTWTLEIFKQPALRLY